MATASCWVSGLPGKVHQFRNLSSSTFCQLLPPNANPNHRSSSSTTPLIKANSKTTSESVDRRVILLGAGTLAQSFLLPRAAFAEEVPERYEAFVDPIDGYSYYYPSDWRNFDFTGCDSAFKDRNVALQHVRVSFVPTEKQDINDLGPMEEVIPSLVKNVYAAPTQKPTILEMEERSIDGKNYWIFEYVLQTPTFARTAFATVAIGNGRYYTLVVGANERRWKRVRSRLKTVADSFRLVDI